jgi:hypothetical protein
MLRYGGGQSTDTQDRGKSLVWMLIYGGGQSTDTWDRGKSLMWMLRYGGGQSTDTQDRGKTLVLYYDENKLREITFNEKRYKNI